MPFIGIRGFTTWKQKQIQWQNVIPSAGLNLGLWLSFWFQAQHTPFWAKLAFTCKTESLTKSSKSKN